MTDEPDLQAALLKLIELAGVPAGEAADAGEAAGIARGALPRPEAADQEAHQARTALVRARITWCFRRVREPIRLTGVFRRMRGGLRLRAAQRRAAGTRSQAGYLHSGQVGPATPPPATPCWCGWPRRRDHARPNPEGEIVEIIERETHQFVGVYFEDGGPGLRAGRRHALRAADPGRRSRREERPAGRQGRLRDGPLSLARARRRRGDRRGARPARRAGRRHAVDHSRVRPAGRVSGRRAGRGPAGGRRVRRIARRAGSI